MSARGAALALAAWCVACDCRPVPASRWRDLQVSCDEQSPFGGTQNDQVILESDASLEDFLRHDCLRGSTSITRPDVDFSREVAVVDAVTSPLPDGTCLRERRVAEVQACVDGIAIFYDDVVDPECGSRKLTGSVALRREDVRGPFWDPRARW